MMYMRAHGNAAGPSQRPGIAGAVSALFGAAAAFLLMVWTHGLATMSAGVHLAIPYLVAEVLVLMVLAGAVYGKVFNRAANDPHGGWLFGLCYGFLTWMLGPTTWVLWTTGRPLSTGMAAVGIMGAHFAYGLVLGLLFPVVHARLQRGPIKPLSFGG